MRRFSGAFVFSAAILIAVSGFLVPVSLAGRPEQTRPPQKLDPQVQLLNYYRQYPDRYIRISDESWRLDEPARVAYHSFKLKNTAGVAYSGIEIRLIYLRSDGKTLQSQVLKIQGILKPYSTMQVKELKTRNVTAASDRVLLAVAKAAIHP